MVSGLDFVPWDIEISGTPERLATGPNGETATVVDVVTAVRRRSSPAAA